MYVLVLFTEEESHEIVCRSWIDGSLVEGALREVAYPSKNDTRNIRSLLKKKVDPKSTWCSYEARILFFDGKWLVEDFQSYHAAFLNF